MPRILSAASTLEKNRLASDHPYIMLLTLAIQGGGGPGDLHYAAYDQDIPFWGRTYLRAPLEIDLLEDATGVSLVHLQVHISNVNQEFIALCENYWATVADPQWQVSIWQVDAMAPEDTPFAMNDVFSVASVATDFLSATVDLVAEGVTLATLVPKRRFTATSGFANIARRV